MSDVWKILSGTPRRLDRSRYRDIPGSMPAKQPCRTGFSPREAQERLVGSGLSADEARRQVERAVREHAEEVVASWGQWVERQGFLDEMAALSPADRDELLRRERWDDLTRQVALLTTVPAQAAAEQGLLADLLERAERLNRRDASHPSVFVLRRLHGLPAGLAEAAALYSATVSVRALAAILSLTLLTFLICVGSFMSILQGQFKHVALFLATLVFTGFFGFSYVYLKRAKPRREKAWRDRLAAWRAEPETDVGDG